MKHNWEYKKLGEVCVVSAGQGAPQGEQNYCEKGTPFIKAGNLEDLVNGLDESNVQKVSQAIADKHKLKLYKAGSVIFAKSGMSCMKGYVHVLQRDCFVVNHLAVLTPTAIKGDFLKYYLWYSKTYSLVKDEAYPSISLSDIAAYHVPLPPLPIQQKIVAELDKVCLIIDKKKQQLKELDKLAQAIFYDMFGDPVENEKGWEVKKLDEVCDVRDGTHDSPKYIDGGEYILITSKNIVNGKIDYSNISYITKEDYDAINKRSKVDDGDIIMAMIGTIGKPIIVKMENYKFCIKNVALIKFLKDSMVSNVYIQALLNSSSFSQHIMSKNQGGTQKFVSLGTIRKLEIPLPPLSLQQSFAAKIEAIEKQKELISRSIKEAQTLFDERMDYWFD